MKVLFLFKPTISFVEARKGGYKHTIFSLMIILLYFILLSFLFVFVIIIIITQLIVINVMDCWIHYRTWTVPTIVHEQTTMFSYYAIFGGTNCETLRCQTFLGPT